MEKLIKLQSLIQQVEKFALTDAKFSSMFMYLDDTTLEIETYCSDWTIAIYQMFRNSKNIVMYLTNNDKIKVLELRED